MNDLKVNREPISTNEIIFDGFQEQSIELDYILPDYYGDIFKVLKAQVVPRIVSRTVSNDRVIYEMQAEISIWYFSENSSEIQTIHQKLSFSKTAEFSCSGENVRVKLVPRLDYVNCRAVNQRRLDLRGAVSIRIKAFCEQKQEVICDVFGMGMQRKKQTMTCVSKRLYAEKQLEISEEVEMNTAQPPVKNIIRSDAEVICGEKKVIANKLVSKGDINFSVLYATESGNPEITRFSLPYSQIIDMDGINEDFECEIENSVATLEITSNNSGKLRCDVSVNICCTAVRTSMIEIVTDVYSTRYPSSFAVSGIRVDQMPVKITEQCRVSPNVPYTDGAIECVSDAWATVSNINCVCDAESKKVIVSGMLKCCVVGRNTENTPILLEKEEAFEHTISVPSITAESVIEPSVSITDCSYTLSSSDSVSVRAELKISANLFTASVTDAITEITVDETAKSPENNDYALKLYFGRENEDIWEIAKRYGTSVTAIMEENELMEDKLTQNGMILIPMV